MHELFLSEWRRHRNLILATMLVHLVVQYIAYRTGYYLCSLTTDTQISLALLLAGATLLFAAARMLEFRRPGMWHWLMHRPVSRPKIFAALALSGLAQICVAIGLPVLLTILGTDWLTGHPVDLRHYLSVIVLVLFCMMAWMAGVNFLLRPGPTALFLIVSPFIVLTHDVKATLSLQVAVVTLLLMALITYEKFRPDRKLSPVGLAGNALTAIPLVIGFHFVTTVGATLAADWSWRLLSDPPKRQVEEPFADFDSYINAKARKKLANALGDIDDPRRELWQSQIAQAPVTNLYKKIHGYAKHQQLSNRVTPILRTNSNRILWTFDHDVMRFVAIDRRTGQQLEQRGLHGAGDLTPFPSVPLAGTEYLVTPHAVRSFAPDSVSYQTKITLTPPERVLTEPQKFGERYFMLSNQRLIAFDVDAGQPDAPFREAFSLPLPDDRSDFFELALLGDLTLINMRIYPKAAGDPHIELHKLFIVEKDGQMKTFEHRIASKPDEFPLMRMYAGDVASPTVAEALSAIRRVAAGEQWARPLRNIIEGIPFPFARAALAVLLASGLLAWLWLSRATPRARLGWAAACVLLGPPALASLMVMHPRRHYRT